MPFPPMPTQVNCPQCNTRFVAQLHTIVDVGENPELKEQLLRGEINYARCPNCGSGGVLSAPLLYHDPAKELLISFVPNALSMSAQEQEQFIGRLVQMVMTALPEEKRKAYFLQPKSALTFETLLDTILEADGISKAFLEERRAKIRLINSLLAAVEDDKTLDALVVEHRDELDYEFFLMLSDSIDAHREDGDAERAGALETLRGKLLERVNLSAPTAAPQSASVDDLIKLLEQAKPGAEWSAAIALTRPRLDYGFFQALTAKIEAAERAGDQQTVTRLTDLRTRVFDELESQGKRVREAEDQAALLVMTLSEAADLETAVREHINEMDQAFFGVLARFQALSEQRQDTQRAQKLATILETAINVIEEKLPPDVRLVNKLLRADYPDGTNAVLEAHRGLLTDAFIKTLDQYVTDLEQHHDELAAHLKQGRAQIAAKRTILRG